MVQILLSITLFFYIVSVLIVIKRNGYGYLPVFFASYFIFILIIPAFIHVSNNIFPFYNLSYSVKDQFDAAIVLLLFSIFFWFGFFLKSNKVNVKNNYQLFHINQSRFFSIQVISCVLMLIVVLKFGPDAFLVKRSEFDRAAFGENSASRELFLTSIKSLSFACLFYLVIFKKFLNKTFWYLNFFVVIGLFSIINFPLSLPRFVLFSYLIAFFCYYFRSNFRNKLIVLLAFAFGITTLFPYISFLTRGRGDKFQSNMIEYYQSSGDFDGFQSIINTVIYVNNRGYTLGQQILSSIFSYVPRSFWSGKGEPTGSIVASQVGYDYLNISSPLPAEFYIDFGYLGLIVFSFLLGFFFRKIDQYYISVNNINLKYLISILFISLVPILSRGALLAVINNLYASIAIFALIYYIIFLRIRF